MVGKRGLGEDDRKHSYPANQDLDGHLNGDTDLRRRHHHGDLESGKPPKSPHPKGGRPHPRLWAYRDHAALEDARREELKDALLKGIDRNELERFRKSRGEIKEMKNKGMREFYEDQNCRLNDWLEVDAVIMAIADDVLESMNPDPDHDGENERGGELQRVAGAIGQLLPEEEQERRQKAARKAKIAINCNVVANILLLVGKGFAVLTTGSLSLLASLVDSALDLLCTLIVWTTNKLVLWRLNALKRRFPVGRRRLEPLGILVFSVIMVLSFAQILQESLGRLMKHASAEALSIAAIASLVATIVLKGFIGLCCRPIKTTQVQALANVWWLDPLGAGLLSLYIIYDWGHTSFENVVRLSGEAADDRTVRKLTYLAYRFSPVVTGFKAITAYHAGDGIWAEFDLLLDEDTPLNRSHDIAETLQYCAEALGEVDRAFVTTDYAVSGPTGHATDAEHSH
ncbi:cation efflux family protein [Sarocladium implicatum]|nr:cation efflux family protein [Sarocladium implicatum]